MVVTSALRLSEQNLQISKHSCVEYLFIVYLLSHSQSPVLNGFYILIQLRHQIDHAGIGFVFFGIFKSFLNFTQPTEEEVYIVTDN